MDENKTLNTYEDTIGTDLEAMQVRLLQSILKELQKLNNK